MDDSGETYVSDSFLLESGIRLKKAMVRYNCYGKVNEARDNVIVVCHALTGNSALSTWWGGLLGPGKTFDTDKYFVVCANVLGSCYGSSGPKSIDPDTGKPYGMNFPDVTIRDSVALHLEMVQKGLNISRVHAVIGGSMGGMQALEWALLGQTFVRSVVIIGCGAVHTGWQISISEAQRQAIYADPNWNKGNISLETPPLKGLSIARQFAMITYRTANAYHSKFGREKDKTGKWKARSYLEYQGEKFLERFDAIAYVKLTEKMDTHDVGRGRGGVDAALGSIKCATLIMGIDSDILYPLHEQQELTKKIPNSKFKVISSRDGHDG